VLSGWTCRGFGGVTVVLFIVGAEPELRDKWECSKINLDLKYLDPPFPKHVNVYLACSEQHSSDCVKRWAKTISERY
jgi:hypothetical protein